MKISLNRSTLMGLLIVFGVVYFGVLKVSLRPEIFADPHALILVFAGTLGSSLVAFPFSQLKNLLGVFLNAMLFPRSRNRGLIANELMRYAYMKELSRKKKSSPVEKITISDPFAVEAARLIERSRLSGKQLHDLLVTRSHHFRLKYEEDAKILSAIAKFPPAFGLLAASTGMIEMMGGLGTGGTEKIGSAMAIALVGTFWGIALANFVFLPFADHASKLARDDKNIREMIVAVMVQIQLGTDLYTSRETLKGYLSLDERTNLDSYDSLSAQSNDTIIQDVG